MSPAELNSYRRVILRRATGLLERIEFLRLRGDTRDIMRSGNVKCW